MAQVSIDAVAKELSRLMRATGESTPAKLDYSVGSEVRQSPAMQSAPADVRSNSLPRHHRNCYVPSNPMFPKLVVIAIRCKRACKTRIFVNADKYFHLNFS